MPEMYYWCTGILAPEDLLFLGMQDTSQQVLGNIARYPLET